MRKCLVVVDYQKDFVDGALPCGQMAIDIEDNIYNKIQKYRENEDDVLFTFDTHLEEDYKNTTEGKIFPLHCVEGTEGWELYGKIKDLCENPYNDIIKETYGSFNLAMSLFDGCYDEVEFIGVATNVCVLHNVILFYNDSPETKITVDASCCASFDKTLHEQALDMMQGIGVNVINRKES